MRTVKFRDVLWAVAYKTRQDPLQGNFLTNQAISIGQSISQWVHRLWPSQDWPEWTFTLEWPSTNFSHICPYDILSPKGENLRIGKVFAVYLVDPTTTNAPIETDFKLTPFGIHVGFDHGAHVWIKFTPPPPVYTAEVWLADRNYNRDEVVYLDRSGQCYKSRFNGNKNHEPEPFGADVLTLFGPPPTSEVTQEAQSGQRGSPVQPMIVDIYHIVAADSLHTGKSFVIVNDITGTVANVSYNHGPGNTQVSIITSLYNLLVAAPGLSGYVITLDTANLKIRLSANLHFDVAKSAGWTRQVGIVLTTTTLDKVVQIQPYVAGITSVAPTQQKTEFQFTPEQLVIGATYTFTIVDPSSTEHTFEYISIEGDSIESVMAGLGMAMAAAVAGDDYFSGVSVEVDNASLKFIVSTPKASVDADIKLPGQPYWELVPFPWTLFDPVVAGAKSDVEKEWGQTQEGMAEEQRVGPETTTAASNFSQSPEPLTEQQNKPSRYKAA